MKDLGEFNHFIGIDFDITQRCVKMNQKRYIGRVLERFDMSNCKPRTILCEQRIDLSNTSDPECCILPVHCCVHKRWDFYRHGYCDFFHYSILLV